MPIVWMIVQVLYSKSIVRTYMSCKRLCISSLHEILNFKVLGSAGTLLTRGINIRL